MIIMLNLGLISFIIILIGGIILVLIVRKIEVLFKCIKNQVRIYKMNVPMCVHCKNRIVKITNILVSAVGRI